MAPLSRPDKCSYAHDGTRYKAHGNKSKPFKSCLDERLPELLLHYKAKNFPISLSEDETKKWEEYRLSRLKRQEPYFLKELERIAMDEKNSFIVEELKLWYESLAPEL